MREEQTLSLDLEDKLNDKNMDRKKILVVEDETFIAMDIKQTLERENYEVRIDCFTVDMAIEMVETWGPDLVLIDVNLNDRKNGLDLAQYLKCTGDLPFIFLTSYSDKNTLSLAANIKPTGYITKPFKPSDLISSAFLALQMNPVNRETSDSTIPFQITQVLTYINQHIREKLDLQELARLTGWENEHFGRVFKENVGLTPYQYILKSKIELAKALLNQPDVSSASISYNLGFSSYSNFYTSFKKFTNLSPEQYKKLVK
jgi:YesN/AraC family two-component response regulator